MKLAPLVPKPKPPGVGNHKVQRKPKSIGLAWLPEPDADGSESFGDEQRNGDVGSVSMLADRRPQRVAPHGWQREPESNSIARRIAELSVARNDDMTLERVPTRELFANGIMTKLVVGDANDPLEHEADAIADRVMRMHMSSTDAVGWDIYFGPGQQRSVTPIQRTCSTCEAEDDELHRTMAPLQRACSTCETEDDELHRTTAPLQRACTACEAEDDDLRREPAAGTRGGPTTPRFTGRLHDLQRQGGHPLTTHARAFFEPRFNTDLTQVRLHTDPTAAQLAQQIHARAFTSGQHIFFGPGEHRPNSQAGQRLLAHELAHTQQNARVHTHAVQTEHEDDLGDFMPGSAMTARRKCNGCQEEEELHRTPAGSDVTHVHAAASPRGGSTSEQYAERVRKLEAGCGRPLRSHTRSFFEQRLGVDLGSIRIHTGPEPARLAEAVRARAFTHGQHVFFGNGEYQPDSRFGVALLAHELVHTIQARGSMTELRRIPLPPASCPIESSDIASLFISTQEIVDIRASTFQQHKQTLRHGDRGDAVGALQAFLLRDVCATDIEENLLDDYRDREFGSATKVALRDFQALHDDAAGVPLGIDGILGPRTLSAIDLVLDLEPVAPDASNSRYHGDCVRQTPGQQGAGRVDFDAGEHTWTLWNFDIDDHQLKSAHAEALEAQVAQFLREEIAHALETGGDVWIEIAGMTSTTGSAEHNDALGWDRASCVRDFLRSRLDDGSKQFLDIGYHVETMDSIGEKQSEQRIEEARGSGQEITINDLEDPRDRAVRVSVAIDEAEERECTDDRLRQRGTEFAARIGCTANGLSIVISRLGDAPVTREFMWIPDFPIRCPFYPKVDPDEILPFHVLTPIGYTLADDPEPASEAAPSDFEGNMDIRSVADELGGDLGHHRTMSGGGAFSIRIGGAQVCEAGMLDSGEFVNKGQLVAVSEAQCRRLDTWKPFAEECPIPEASDCDPESMATHFRSQMVYGSGTAALELLAEKLDAVGGRAILKKLELLFDLLPVGVVPFGGALFVNTCKTAEEKAATGQDIQQVVVFMGAALTGKCANREFSLLSDKWFDTAEPAALDQLSYGFGGGTFTHAANSNVARLDIGIGEDAGFGQAFELFGETCAGGPDLEGPVRWASLEPYCGPIEFGMANQRDDGCTEDECPERLLTCGARTFTAHFGRIDPDDFDSTLRLLRRFMGCDIAAARVNIETFEPAAEQLADEPLKRWRPFYLIAQAKPDPFSFIQGSSAMVASNEDVDAIRLTTGSEEDAPSDLTAILDITHPAILGLGAGYLPDVISKYGSDRGALFTIIPPRIDWQGSENTWNGGFLFPAGMAQCGSAPLPTHTPPSDEDSACIQRKKAREGYLRHLVKAHLGGKLDETIAAWDENNDLNAPFTMMTPIEQGAKLNHGQQADLIGLVDESTLFDTKAVPVIISGGYVVKHVEHIPGTCLHNVLIEFKDEPCAYDEDLHWHRLLQGESCENTDQRSFWFVTGPVTGDAGDYPNCAPDCPKPEAHSDEEDTPEGSD